MSRSRRDIGKFLVSIAPDALTPGLKVSSEVMGAAVQPGTITGLRWDLSFLGSAAEGTASYRWCIFKLKSGLSVPELSLDNGAAITPDLQSVIAFGSGQVRGGGEPQEEHGTTKSMRKLYNGDKLYFIAKSDGAINVTVRGTVQFFYRT